MVVDHLKLKKHMIKSEIFHIDDVMDFDGKLRM